MPGDPEIGPEIKGNPPAPLVVAKLACNDLGLPQDLEEPLELAQRP